MVGMRLMALAIVAGIAEQRGVLRLVTVSLRYTFAGFSSVLIEQTSQLRNTPTDLLHVEIVFTNHLWMLLHLLLLLLLLQQLMMR